MHLSCLYNGHIGNRTESGFHICDRCGLHAFYRSPEAIIAYGEFGFSYEDAGKGLPAGFYVTLDGKFLPYWNELDKKAANEALTQCNKIIFDTRAEPLSNEK